jgi:hypothetical protein
MKVIIGKPKNWFGPYQLAELLCFWAKPVKDEFGTESKPEWVHDFGEWLAYGSLPKKPEVGELYDMFHDDREITLLYKVLTWIHSKREQKVCIRIDPWDTWSMDSTLAPIILPMLKQLKTSKHGAPFVDDEDVPEHLRSTAALPKEDEHDVDGNHFARWDWILDEMIFAFECKAGDKKDWEDQFYQGVADHKWKKLENGYSELVQGPNHTYKCDLEGLKAFDDRIQKGLILFGKYYRSLWD